MQNIYAALLLHKAGKEINEENLKKVVQAVGAETDESQIRSLVVSLKGVDIDKELESASLAVAPSGGDLKSVPAAKPKEEKPKEEKAPAAEGLSALFGWFNLILIFKGRQVPEFYLVLTRKYFSIIKINIKKKIIYVRLFYW